MRPLLAVAATLAICLPANSATAGVDTLRGPAQIGDAVVYSWENCNSEITGEDCRRYNAGGLSWISAGRISTASERRTFFAVLDEIDSLPDSAHLKLYCYAEGDTVDRQLFVYPTTRPILAGTELDQGVGNYPDPDSGVTWLHAWLDHGDRDSLSWTQPGGDYSVTSACTTLVTDEDAWVTVRHVERLLSVIDTSGGSLLLINENSFPAKSSFKNFVSSQGDSTYRPMLLLFYGESSGDRSRRRRICQTYK